MLILTTSINTQAGYRIISHDYIVNADDIKLTFNPSLIKQTVEVSFQRCPSCEWLDKVTTDETDFFLKEIPISYKDFKKSVKSYQYNPPSKKYRALISIDTRNNEIFSINWNYVER